MSQDGMEMFGVIDLDEPMRPQVESWRAQQLPRAAAKLMMYRAFTSARRSPPSLRDE